MTPFHCLLSRKLESAGKEKIAIHNMGLSVLAVALTKAKILFWYKIIEPDLFMGCGSWRFLQKTAGSMSGFPFLRESWPSPELLLIGNEFLCRRKIFAWVNDPSSRAFNSSLAWKYGMLLQRVISIHVTQAWSRKELYVWPCQARLGRGQGAYELGFSIFTTGTGNLQPAEILCQVY